MRPSDAVCRSLILTVGVFELGLKWMWLLKSSNGKIQDTNQRCYSWKKVLDACISVTDTFNFKSVFLQRVTCLCFLDVCWLGITSFGCHWVSWMPISQLALWKMAGWSGVFVRHLCVTTQIRTRRAHVFLFSQSFSQLIMSCFSRQCPFSIILFVWRLSLSSWNGVYLPTM